MASPMEFFNIGRAGGAANAHPIGAAIRSIVEQGQKKDLINTQVQGQYDASVNLASHKAGIDSNLRSQIPEQPAPEVRRDPASGKTTLVNYSYDKNTGTWVERISPSSFNLTENVLSPGTDAMSGFTGQGGVQGQQDMNALIESISQNLYK